MGIKLAEFSNWDPVERRLQRLLLGHAFECEMDSSGRRLISSTLRDYANLTTQAISVGVLNKFELWDQDKWNLQIEEDIQHKTVSLNALNDRLRHFSL